MNEKQLLFILLVHFVLDFGLQTNWQALNKSVDSRALAWHVTVYSVMWVLLLIPLGATLQQLCLFFTVTYMFHFLTDFFTSRLGKPFWENKDFHNGFLIVGFDQVLHYVQLYLTFKHVFT